MMRLTLRAVWLASALTASACASSNSVVNLSHYDELRPNFAQMRREGVVAVIHEATYPLRTVDVAYGTRQREAALAGLLWGAYHFSDATDPIRQADHFLQVVGEQWRSAPRTNGSLGVLLVLDFERNGHYPGGTMQADQAVAFVERVRACTGRYPGIYASENRIAGVLNLASPAAKNVLRKCWLWIANYHYPPRATAPWSHWDLWQYTGDGVCDLPRVSYPKDVANIRNAERNIFRGSTAAVRSFWEANAWDPARR